MLACGLTYRGQRANFRDRTSFYFEGTWNTNMGMVLLAVKFVPQVIMLALATNV